MADAVLQTIPAEGQRDVWPAWERLLFRFVCCYWILYALPAGGRVSILGTIPGTGWLTKPWVSMWHAVVPWTAIHVFGVTGHAATYFRTGSGDTTLGYVENFLCLVVALVAAAIWSVLERRRRDYRGLAAWLRVFVRYTLALTLFTYGFAKVFPLQFRPPGLARLIEPYGEFSPMGALWWFMGASVPYIIFSGAAEVTGGLLLLFRRTTTLGAMVSAAVMANVVALNFCYDVPVKLYSTNILLMALFLLAPELPRLVDFFVRNRAAAPADPDGTQFSRRWMRVAANVFWVLLVAYVLGSHVVTGWESYRDYYLHPNRPPLYGLYDVENGYERWRKVALQYPGSMTVRTTDDTVLNMRLEYGKDTVTLNKKETWKWSRPDADHIVLESGDKLVKLRKIDASKFLLLSRGFHWINETPLNQ